MSGCLQQAIHNRAPNPSCGKCLAVDIINAVIVKFPQDAIEASRYRRFILPGAYALYISCRIAFYRLLGSNDPHLQAFFQLSAARLLILAITSLISPSTIVNSAFGA